MIRRRIILVYWVFALTLFVPSAAYAYIDPATTTYLVQIMTALVVTVGVSLSIFLYKFRMISAKIKYGFFGFLYRIRNNEPETARVAGKGGYGETPGFVYPSYAMPGEPYTPPKPKEEKLGIGGYKARLRTIAPLALVLPLSLIFIGCFDLALQNAFDMPFRPSSMIAVLLAASGAVFAFLLFALPVFRGAVYRILLSLGLAVLLSAYIQGNFMNGALDELNGEIIDWKVLAPQIGFSVLLWAAVFGVVFVLMRYAKSIWRAAVVFVPLFLLVIQGAGLAASYDDHIKSGDTSFWAQVEETLTIDGLESPSKGKNAIVFVLDRLDDKFVDMIAERDPDFFEPLDGFTRFDDNITYAASTFPSVAEMLTGKRYEYDRSMIAYLDYAWGSAEWLQTMKERGVDLRFYMDRGYAYTGAKQMEGLAGNLFEGKSYFSKRIALVKLLKLSAFRYAPMPLKQGFWISPTEFNDALQTTDSTTTYLTNDFDFYAEISRNGLAPADSDKAFIYYHLQGAHGPLNMDENMDWKEESDADYTVQRVSQSMGCFKILYYYFDQLKALGLYEDATIIVTADHPDFLGDELAEPALAALFVKPAGSAGTPLAYSHAPVCPAQLPATVMEGLFGGADGFGQGYFDVEDGMAVTRNYDVKHYRYEIEGDGRDFSNWRYIGMYEGGAESVAD